MFIISSSKFIVSFLPPTLVHLSMIFCNIITNCSRYLIFEQIRYHRRNKENQPDPDKPATKEVFSREISFNRPPAPLPPDVTRVPSRPDSDYENVEDILDHRRGSAISDATQRFQAPDGPKRSLDASIVSIPWPWPYNDVRNTTGKKPSPPPLPAKNCQTEDGLDNNGYLECV